MSILTLISDTLSSPAAAGNIEYNGQFYGTDSNAARAQLQRITQATAQASTSGTSIAFTSIPSWVKKITVMLAGVSTSSTNVLQLQIGTGGAATITGYVGAVSTTGGSQNAMSTGFSINNNMTAAGLFSGIVTLTLLNGNTWVEAGTIMPAAGTPIGAVSAGYLALGGTLDYLRIIGSSTGNPADTFDAGSINILYE